MIVRLTTDRTERVDPGSELQSKRGPMVVRASRAHQKDWIVQFDGVPDRTAAEELRGLVLLAAPLDDDDVLWVHELVGAAVVTVGGEAVGTVTAVEANPASDLLVLDSGPLIPLRFVVSKGDGQVVVDLPEGLLDL